MALVKKELPRLAALRDHVRRDVGGFLVLHALMAELEDSVVVLVERGRPEETGAFDARWCRGRDEPRKELFLIREENVERRVHREGRVPRLKEKTPGCGSSDVRSVSHSPDGQKQAPKGHGDSFSTGQVTQTRRKPAALFTLFSVSGTLGTPNRNVPK